MKNRRRKFAAPDRAWVVLLAVAVSACVADDVDDPQLDRSRALVKTFGMQLQAELKSALQEGGPVQAVKVCKEVAPRIAADISEQSGAHVTRTSLRYRNPANAPQAWQLPVLRGFDQQAKAAKSTAPLEFFESHSSGSSQYMRAIPTDGVCLACHGDVIAPALQEVLQQEYPNDLAVGYELGDVRGAFSVTWPSETGG